MEWWFNVPSVLCLGVGCVCKLMSVWWSHTLPPPSPSYAQIPIPSVPTLQPSTLIPERLEAVQRYIRELQYPFDLCHIAKEWKGKPGKFPALTTKKNFCLLGTLDQLGKEAQSPPKGNCCLWFCHLKLASFCLFPWHLSILCVSKMKLIHCRLLVWEMHFTWCPLCNPKGGTLHLILWGRSGTGDNVLLSSA